MPKGKVLSIQSHVVSSYVGSKGAIFILQLHGFDVDPIFSVIWSNHTAYSNVYGHIVDYNEFYQLYQGLSINHLNTYDYVISGFMKDASFASYLPKVIRDLKSTNKNLKYYFDPVLGDNGKFYCPESFVELYRKELLPIADIITPNQFEVEKLTGININNKTDILQACYNLHRLGTKTVIITSIQYDQSDPDQLTCVVSDLEKTNEKSLVKTVFITYPKFKECIIGTGDTFTALILASLHSDRLNGSLYFHQLQEAIIYALLCMHEIIKKSLSNQSQPTNNPNKCYKIYELELADCVDIILGCRLTTTTPHITPIITSNNSSTTSGISSNANTCTTYRNTTINSSSSSSYDGVIIQASDIITSFI